MCERTSEAVFQLRSSCDSFDLSCFVVGSVVDQEAERHVQPVRLADAASRPPGGTDHCQHHGPAGEDHDQQSGQQTGEGAQISTRCSVEG